jgi:hypothetical protein
MPGQTYSLTPDAASAPSPRSDATLLHVPSNQTKFLKLFRTKQRMSIRTVTMHLRLQSDSLFLVRAAGKRDEKCEQRDVESCVEHHRARPMAPVPALYPPARVLKVYEWGGKDQARLELDNLPHCDKLLPPWWRLVHCQCKIVVHHDVDTPARPSSHARSALHRKCTIQQVYDCQSTGGEI